jgi:uncharacterized cupredoxin-like copper-binding protein
MRQAHPGPWTGPPDHPRDPRAPIPGRLLLGSLLGGLLVAAAGALAGCGGADATQPPITRAGTPDRPRELNIVAKDYLFLPPEVELVPGETVLLHVINGGLAAHEAVIGDQAVQDAWEVAEAPTVDAPPGPTPVVSVPPGVGGLRIVVASGQRQDVLWTVPLGGELIVGCHVPGHYAKGMHVPVRFVVPAASAAPATSAAP